MCLCVCVGFICFPRILTPCEMKTASFGIWTRVGVCISFDGIHNTPRASIKFLIQYMKMSGDEIHKRYSILYEFKKCSSFSETIKIFAQYLEISLKVWWNNCNKSVPVKKLNHQRIHSTAVIDPWYWLANHYITTAYTRKIDVYKIFQ